jgi:DNA-binding NarL/FixJ family response regulator
MAVARGKARGTLPERIRVLIADADSMGAQLMASALKRCRDQFEVVGLTSTAHEAIHQMSARKPHVAILGMELEDGPRTGLAVLEKLRESPARVAGIMLVQSPDREMVVQSFRGGARGVISRKDSFKALAKCIRCVHEGQIWINNEQIEYLISAFAPLRPRLTKANGMALLTSREKAVTDLVGQGMKNREIAKALQVTDHTVSNYLYRIFEKLGVSNRVELILFALSRQGSE